MKIKTIKIDFYVTEDIQRFVNVYLIVQENYCLLIDSGVYGCEFKIEEALKEEGFSPYDIKGILLTHSHPDHIGGAYYFKEKYGTKIYAGDKKWIEDIDDQYKERPIPNFYKLVKHL